MFGTCVYFFKKSWTYVWKINFFNLDKNQIISLCCFSSDQTSALQNLHRRLRASTARLSFTVIGLCSKIQPEIELDSLLTQHSKIQVRIWISPSLSMGFGFCFSSPIGKTHFSCSLFAVERWVSFFISGVRVGWVLRHEGEHREERRDEMEERRQN